MSADGRPVLLYLQAQGYMFLPLQLRGLKAIRIMYDA